MLFDLSFVKIRPLRYRQQREAMSLGTEVGYPESLGRKARHSTNNRAPNPPNYDSESAASEFFPRPTNFSAVLLRICPRRRRKFMIVKNCQCLFGMLSRQLLLPVNVDR
jgi:hypothetical protein